jgi:bacterioferritin-associated ferredoxin
LATNSGDPKCFIALHKWPSGRLETMTGALAALAIAVSGTSLICFALMTRAERHRNGRRTSSNGDGSDGGTYSSGDTGGHFWSWLGGDQSASDSPGHWGGSDGLARRGQPGSRRWRWWRRLMVLAAKSLQHFDLPQQRLFRFVPVSNQGSVWNHFKRPFFLLHPVGRFTIERDRSTDGPVVFMIVCSCNVLSDHDVRSAVESAQDLPRNAKQIYGCLGCSAECGRCARTIKTIIDEALGACARACGAGCPHSGAGTHRHVPDALALEPAA